MKWKDLRDNLTEAEGSALKGHMQNISRLVRRGLLPASDLPRLRTALISYEKKKDMAKLPSDQRTVLQKYNAAIENAALGSNKSVNAITQNINAGFEISGNEFLGEAAEMKDPPMMMVLKRKGIRIFPDGKRVALYVNEKLGLTFTVPYSAQGIENAMTGVTEEVVSESISQLKNIVAENEPGLVKFNDDTAMEVHHELANKILMLHNKLDNNNQEILAGMLSSSKGEFLKVAQFAHEKIKPMVPNA